MAYKFQLGAFVASGSIKAEDGLVATDVDDVFDFLLFLLLLKLLASFDDAGAAPRTALLPW